MKRSLRPKTAIGKLKSFLFGFGSVVDLSGSQQTPHGYYDYFKFEKLPHFQDPDADAIAKDWAVVGKDISFAIEKFESEHPELVTKV